MERVRLDDVKQLYDILTHAVNAYNAYTGANYITATDLSIYAAKRDSNFDGMNVLDLLNTNYYKVYMRDYGAPTFVITSLLLRYADLDDIQYNCVPSVTPEKLILSRCVVIDGLVYFIQLKFIVHSPKRLCSILRGWNMNTFDWLYIVQRYAGQLMYKEHIQESDYTVED